MKVLRLFKYLSQHNVEFSIGHLFNHQKLNEEILPKYPDHQVQILQFANQIKSSIKIAFGIIVSIVLAGVLLNLFFK